MQPEKIQAALQYQGKFTDYSGRTFSNCTAYEYSYWAKDTHMCRMLELHMDDATKAYMLARINEIERIDADTGQPVGLAYHQGGLELRSAHFDLTPLITALKSFVRGADYWDNAAAKMAAWMKVGVEQRDMPVHVLNEYCHPERDFYPIPEFNEKNLPRSVIFFNWRMESNAALFPLVSSDSAGLGVSFALFRCSPGCVGASRHRGSAAVDLAALKRLDEVRGDDLTRSRKNLQPTHQELNHSMRV